MPFLIEVPVGDTTVLMDVKELDQGLAPAARPGRAVARAARSFEEMLDGVRAVAESCVKRFSEMEVAPSEVNVELGITLSAEADVVIASTSTEANISVSLTWKSKD